MFFLILFQVFSSCPEYVISGSRCWNLLLIYVVNIFTLARKVSWDVVLFINFFILIISSNFIISFVSPLEFIV